MKKSVRMLSMALLASSALLVGSASAQINPKLPKPGEAPAGSPVDKHGQLKVGKVGSAGAILDKSGSAVALKGMSLFWATGGDGIGYYNDATVGWLAHDWSVSVVRAAIGVKQDDGGGNPGFVDGNASGMLNAAKSVVEAAIKRGIYVIVDWHTHNNPSTSDAVRFFSEISKAYGQYPNVLYEVWNEPIGQQFGEIKNHAEQIIKSGIRPNSDNLVIVGSPRYSSQPNDANNNQVSDSKNNTAYSIHMYACTHGYSDGSGYGGNMNSAINAGLAVFATEWGSVRAEGDGSPCTGAADSWVTAMKSKNVGWAYWSVTHKKEGASVLQSAAYSGGPWSLTSSGDYIRPIITRENNAAYSSWSKKYNVNATAGEGGKIEKKVGTAVNNGPYDFGTTVTVAAVPNAGFELSGWEGDASGNNASLSYKVVGVNVDVKAVFVPTSLVKNGYFTSNVNSWTSNNVTLSHDAAAGAMIAEVTAGGTESSPSNVRQGNINRIEAGKKYSLSFTAWTSSGTRKITPRVTNSNRDRNYIPDTAAIEISTTKKTFTKEFSMCYKTAAGVAVTDSNAVLMFQCNAHGADKWTWYLDDVKLDEVGAGTCSGTAAASPIKVHPHLMPWSISRTGGALQLRGPEDAGAKASLYNVRGKMVRSMAAKDGLSLSAAGIPAGNYVLVVKNGSGAEVLRSMVVMTR
jgi:hypothetical protein